MYIIRTNRILPEPAVADYVERFDRANEVASGWASFLGAVFLNSLGYPSVYTTIIQFEHRAAAQEFHSSPEWRTFTWENPMEGMGTRIGLQEAYELVNGVTCSGEAEIAVLTDWTLDLDPRVLRAFIEASKEMIRLRTEHGQGVVASRLLSFMGNPTKFLEMDLYVSRADFDATHQTPEILDYLSAHPASQYFSGTPDMEVCEVIRQM